MTAEQKEELRRLSLRWMVDRSALAYNVTSIHAGISREMPATRDEVSEALELLVGLQLLAYVPNKLGGARYYKASAEGILAQERGI